MPGLGFVPGQFSDQDKIELLFFNCCSTGPSPYALNNEGWTLWFHQMGCNVPGRESLMSGTLPALYNKFMTFVRASSP